MSNQPTEMSTTDWLDGIVKALREATDRLAAVVTDDPRQQWNAYCEFAYAFVFLCDQQLGHALAAKGLPEEEIPAKIGIVDHIILTLLLAQRCGVDPASEMAEAMYSDHHRVLEQRAEAWMGMPFVEAEGAKGPAGTFTWEVPKQALRSAGEEELDFLKVTEASGRFWRSAMALPKAMEYLAGTL